jgi:copper chaperone CopZ
METIVFKIEGMTCSHCVQHVEKALKAVPGVVDADVILEKGETIMKTEGPLNEISLLKAVADAGYRARRA